MSKPIVKHLILIALGTFFIGQALVITNLKPPQQDDTKLENSIEYVIPSDVDVASRFNQWSYPWQRWFATSQSVQQMEVLLRDHKVIAVEKEREESNYLITREKLYFFSGPDKTTNEDFYKEVKKQKLPIRKAADSNFLAVLASMVSIIFSFVAILVLYSIAMNIAKKWKSRRMIKSSLQNSLKFSDIAGQEGVKESLQDVVEFLKNPDKFKANGARMPAGILLEGEPGNGKTMLARALAGEAGVPFYNMAGSEFEDMFVGVGASRVRDLFNMARKHPISIVFIDEFDAIGTKRKIENGKGSAKHDNQLLNQLLTELDGFNRKNRVFFVGATNLAESLDPALTRSGRLDRKVYVPPPNLTARQGILTLHTKGIKLAQDVNLEELAKATPGFSGADLATMANEAAILASREGKKEVSHAHFDYVMSSVILGNKNASIMTEAERKIVAYHEAGHALVGSLIPGADPVRFGTILPRGRGLGAIVQTPTTDRSLLTRGEYRARLAVSMAGRVAEELIATDPDDVTGGAKGDIKFATKLAREMVGGMGLCEDIGEIDMLDQDSMMSPYIAEKLEKSVKAEIQRAKEIARNILVANMASLKALAEKFLQMESLSGDEIRHTLLLSNAMLPDKTNIKS